MEAAQRSVDTVVRKRSRWPGRLGTALLVSGMLVLAWVLVVWLWNDPFTAVYTRWQQGRLGDQYAEILKEETSRPPTVRPGVDPAVAAAAVRREARHYRARATEGSAIGRIVVPRLGVDMIFVNGTDSGTLKKGPGRQSSTYMPGEGELIYIAGHRTTYLAPFAHIDRLQEGDRVTLEMPYATIVYAVTHHRIVDDEDLSVLKSHGVEEVALQACHPRFFATQRYIVWARPLRVVPRGGTAYTPS